MSCSLYKVYASKRMQQRMSGNEFIIKIKLFLNFVLFQDLALRKSGGFTVINLFLIQRHFDLFGSNLINSPPVAGELSQRIGHFLSTGLVATCFTMLILQMTPVNKINLIMVQHTVIFLHLQFVFVVKLIFKILFFFLALYEVMRSSWLLSGWNASIEFPLLGTAPCPHSCWQTQKTSHETKVVVQGETRNLSTSAHFQIKIVDVQELLLLLAIVCEHKIREV